MTSLAQWEAVWRRLGASDAGEEIYQKLVTCYSEPHRRYHTVQHLDECFTHLEKVRSLAEHADQVEIALWFHDAVYQTTAKDNEQRSAQWARDSVLAAGGSGEQADRIYQLIMTTRHDAVPVGQDAQVLVDIDLSILGAEVARFDEYEVQVREEYSWVPESLYRDGRGKILKEFMAREWIYSTELFRAEYETRARENLARSLARL